MIKIKNKVTKEVMFIKVKVKYDMIPTCCKKCKLLGHEEEKCRVLHPEFRKDISTEEGGEIPENSDQHHHTNH